MIIAVDFDGTIVEDKYPDIGREMPFAFDTLKKLQDEGHKLVLWTVRENEQLQEAVDFCQEHGVKFWSVNGSFVNETVDSQNYTRKLKVDLFIDDRNLGGLPDWGVIYKMVHYKLGFEDIYSQVDMDHQQTKKKSFWGRVFTN